MGQSRPDLVVYEVADWLFILLPQKIVQRLYLDALEKLGGVPFPGYRPAYRLPREKLWAFESLTVTFYPQWPARYPQWPTWDDIPPWVLDGIRYAIQDGLNTTLGEE